MENLLTRRFCFSLLMLLSGFAGISYEILYGRILGSLLGDQFAVSAAVLITFLLGIGLGSVLSYRLWPHLWLIEALIGSCALLFVFGYPAIDALLYRNPLLAGGLEGAVLACVLLLLLPAFLIGCSLPLFAGYLNRLTDRQGFSTAYGIYNFGAGLTALLIEFWLIRALGIHGAVLLIAAINLGVAVTLRVGFAGLRERQAGAQATAFELPRAEIVGLVLVSIGSACFQLFMVKLAELVLGPYRENFALVLSLILFGITFGAFAVRRWQVSFRRLLWLNLAGLVLLLVVLQPASYFYARYYSVVAESSALLVLFKWLLLAVLMGLPAATFGATIPALLVGDMDVAKDSGRLLFIASLANVVGFLLMCFVLHRLLDYGVQLLTIGAFTLLALLVCRPTLRSLAAVLVVGVLLLGAQRICWDEDLLYLSYTSFRDLPTLRAERASVKIPERYRGYQDVFSITWKDGTPYFFINGYISIALDSPAEKIVGALASIFSPATDRALVLGLGSGATASTVGRLFEQTDVVEINPVVVDNLYRMRKWNYGIEENPRVKVVIDDGIHYTRQAQKNYSLILNTVTTPLYFSSSKLYTHDFFEIVRQRLTPGGIYLTWMDARIGDRGVDIILKTLGKSFAHTALLYVKPTYFLLLASQQPISVRQPGIITADAVISQDLLQNYLVDPALLPYRVLSSQAQRFIGDRGAPLNTADRPTLEYEMAGLRRLDDGIPEFGRRLDRLMALPDAAQALAGLPGYDPLKFLLQAEIVLEDGPVARRWRQQLRTVVPNFAARYASLEQAYAEKLVAPAETATTQHDFGLQLYTLGKYAEAKQAFERSLKLDPGHDNAHLSLGLCFEALGQPGQALAQYALESQVDPADPDAPMLAAQLLLKQQRYPEALVQVNRALQLQQDAVRYYYRGVIYERLRQPQAALADYLQARQLGADPQTVDAALARLRPQLHR